MLDSSDNGPLDSVPTSLAGIMAQLPEEPERFPVQDRLVTQREAMSPTEISAFLWQGDDYVKSVMGEWMMVECGLYGWNKNRPLWTNLKYGAWAVAQKIAQGVNWLLGGISLKDVADAPVVADYCTPTMHDFSIMFWMISGDTRFLKNMGVRIMDAGESSGWYRENPGLMSGLWALASLSKQYPAQIPDLNVLMPGCHEILLRERHDRIPLGFPGEHATQIV